MILFVEGANRCAPGAPVGDFVSPQRRVRIGKTKLWAADNGCYKRFDEEAYVEMIEEISAAVHSAKCSPPVFVTLPDVVANYAETMRLWGVWHRPLARLGLNRAFVLQDGAESVSNPVPWQFIEAIFIGGTTKFKLSRFCAQAAERARYCGKWVHMGRVNGLRRLDYARSIGCDSCDGSSLGRFREACLMPAVDSLRQQHLFGMRKFIKGFKP